MTVTIKDVAKLANVSISTVSRVINDSKPVSEEVKKRVLEVIKETGYTPNPVARSLVMKKSRLIGVIVPSIGSFYTGELLNAMEEIAKTYDYEIILCNSYSEVDQEIKFMNLLKTKQVEGIVFITYKIREEHKEFLNNAKIPVVLINRYSEDLDVLAVTVNHFNASYEMTKYLISQGHKKISLIRNGMKDDVFMNDQYRGYKKAMDENNLIINSDYLLDGMYNIDLAYEGVSKMLDMKDKPTAIFATSDLNAIGAINAANDKGLQVPEDISVVGYHDTKIASLFRPKLTVISQPIYDCGAVAIRMLIKKIKGEELRDNVMLLPHQLVVRDSCRKID